MDRRIECPVEVPEDQTLGEFANALRLVPEAGNEWFLDFAVYSQNAQKASVVARVRVQEAFLTAVRDRIDATLKELAQARETANPCVFVAQDKRN